MFEEAFIIKAMAFAPRALSSKYNNKKLLIKRGKTTRSDRKGASLPHQHRTTDQLCAGLHEA